MTDKVVPIAGIKDAIDGAPAIEAPPDDGKPKPQGSNLPAGCPVTPLGVVGDEFYYLDAHQQMRVLKAKEHSRLILTSLYLHLIPLLWEHFPKRKEIKKGVFEIVAWRPEDMAESLMQACGEKGVWNPLDHLRGPGAWRADNGELVLHMGDIIWAGGKWIPPGPYEGHVYPSAPARPRPQELTAKPGHDGPAGELLLLLDSWAWRRGSLDAMLLLGWIGAAILGGALKWRPIVWITGDTSTGKSTLHELIELVLGRALVSVSDASAAGIWQKMGHASEPASIDECEAESDNRALVKVLKLARQASSGGLILRGGADHSATEFRARSCFLFESILVPPLKAQDRSRMAILELDALAEGGVEPVLTPKKWMALGRALRRRMLDGWGHFDDVIAAWRQALFEVGHSGRGADQFGTLMACAEILLHDESDDDERLRWAEKLKAAGLAEAEHNIPDAERCLNRLMSHAPDFYKAGERNTVGRLIKLATSKDQNDRGVARRALENIGIKVLDQGETADVLVANDHQGLAKIFDGSDWHSGVWTQSLRRLTGATAAGPRRYAGAQSRGTSIPVNTIFPKL